MWALAATKLAMNLEGALELEAGALLYDGKSFVSGEVMSAPSVIDWNNDGKKDLLVGQFTQGKAQVFLNRGTDQLPAFEGSSWISVNGKPLTTSYG
jgi:hypothetical protein